MYVSILLFLLYHFLTVYVLLLYRCISAVTHFRHKHIYILSWFRHRLSWWSCVLSWPQHFKWRCKREEISNFPLTAPSTESAKYTKVHRNRAGITQPDKSLCRWKITVNANIKHWLLSVFNSLLHRQYWSEKNTVNVEFIVSVNYHLCCELNVASSTVHNFSPHFKGESDILHWSLWSE